MVTHHVSGDWNCVCVSCAVGCGLNTGAAQDCNVTMVTGDVQLLVDRSVSPYCLQCVDGSGMAHPDTQWILDDGTLLILVTANSPSPTAEVVDGVLILLDLMTLLRDGHTGYLVQCTQPFNYDITLFSSSKAHSNTVTMPHTDMLFLLPQLSSHPQHFPPPPHSLKEVLLLFSATLGLTLQV